MKQVIKFIKQTVIILAIFMITVITVSCEKDYSNIPEIAVQTEQVGDQVVLPATDTIGIFEEEYNIIENGTFEDNFVPWNPSNTTVAQVIEGFIYFGGDDFRLMQGLAQVGVRNKSYRLQFDYLAFVPFQVKFTRPGQIMTLVTLPATTDWQHFDTTFKYQYEQIRMIQFTGQLGNVNLDNISMVMLKSTPAPIIVP